MNTCIFGGEERVINQVELFGASDKYHKDMGVSEILEKSRAMKLSNKMHDREMNRRIINMARGEIQYSKIDPSAEQIIPIPDKSRNPLNRSKKIEELAAAYTASIFKQI